MVIKKNRKKHCPRYFPGQRHRKHENLKYFKEHPVNSAIETTQTISNRYIQPQEWASGSIKGALARGCFVIDLEWGKGMPEKIKVESLNWNSTIVVFKDKELEINIQKGKSLVLE